MLLERIEELNIKKNKIADSQDVNYNGNLMDSNVRSRLAEIEKLIKFNTYLFHWLEDPPSGRLQ